jgi:8-oxo-dGTP pyrophosphatase MutT (NUDIX family)
VSDEVDLERVRRVLSGRDTHASPGDDVGAAVAAILREGERDAEVLLIRRAERHADPWSGHMAFPGGRRDASDRDLVETAMRETREEVGLSLDRSAKLLGRLDDIPAIGRGRLLGIQIRPFVFELHETPDLVTNEEVAEALWAPLGPMLRGEVDTVRPVEHEGMTFQMPAYDVEGRIVWGLTHRMLQLLLDIVREKS